MTHFELFETVMVPFPYTDMPLSRLRPALVLSEPAFTDATRHVLMAMITSAKRSAWPNDTQLVDLESAGLNIPSVVRMKLFTLSEKLIQRPLGRLSNDDVKNVQRSLHRHTEGCLSA